MGEEEADFVVARECREHGQGIYQSGLWRPLSAVEQVLVLKQMKEQGDAIAGLRRRLEGTKASVPLKDQKCGNCRFWEANGEDDEYGETPGYCRRFPPVIPVLADQFLEGSDIRGVMPETLIGQWCGEWKAEAK